MLRLDFELKQSWPKLAWVAEIDKNEVFLRHGPMVEIGQDWAVEAVWDGKFEFGDFDKTELVFGSGIRKRENEIVFVSSSTGVDRLWHVNINGIIFISNTLPGLLSASGLSLQSDYEFYSEDIESLQIKGIFSCKKKIPSIGPCIHMVYFNNLVYRSGELHEISKSCCKANFYDYKSYEKYLKDGAVKIGKNSRSSFRKSNIEMLVGLSSGYDSIATAVVAKNAGCYKAVSIANSTSFWRGSDSGKDIAELLGLQCELYRQDRKKYKKEISLWAGSGTPGGRNFSVFDYPGTLSIFFSGGYGDVVWDRQAKEITEPKGGLNEILSEFRIIQGFFVSVVPWWGIQKARQIQKINFLDEMKPWTLGTDYDRPIARRLIEEAGVPRGLFGVRKKDTSSNSPLRWPSTALARKSFRNYLMSRGISPPGWIRLNLFLFLSHASNLVYKNTFKRFGVRKWWRPWLRFPGRKQLFIWANHSLRDMYYEEK